jgi:hypothetical protein
MEMNRNDQESIASIVIGALLGIAVVIFLQYFPGEPFEYVPNKSPGLVAEEPMPVESLITSPGENATLKQCREKSEIEAEKEARLLRVEKLQKMLGLEEDKIKEMIAQAKQDTLDGKTVTEPTNYMAIIDKLVYLTFFAMLCYFANRDYGLNIFEVLEFAFPKETDTLRQLFPWKEVDSPVIQAAEMPAF